MVNKIRLAAPIQKESIADGKGVRMVVWSQGCLVHCPGCHNPETHDPCGGKEIEIQEVKDYIKKYAPCHQGITLTGGDPFLQPKANLEIAKYAHSLGLDVWAYCGKTFDQLKQNEATFNLLKECDVLVDGPFILAQRDVSLAFRGSTNQRVIDVQKSLKKGEVVLFL